MPATNLKVTLGGILRGGESWTVNPWFGVSFGEVPEDYDAFQAAAEAVAAVIPDQPLLQALGSGNNLSRVRLEGRDDSGALLVVGEASAQHAGQTGQGDPMPNQVAMALSLLTNAAGARRRGRVFWPLGSAAISATTGRIANPIPSTVATAFSAYLADIAAALAEGFTEQTFFPMVWSPTDQNRAVVTRVRAGDVADTVRNRRKGLVESYSVAGYPPAAAAG